jgi:hypothetical protein
VADGSLLGLGQFCGSSKLGSLAAKPLDTNGERTLGPLPIWLLDSAGNPA